MTPASEKGQAARALLILRGALAEPSGSEDDPWTRVVLAPPSDAPGAGAAPAFEPPPAEAGEDDDALRARVRSALAGYRARHGRAPLSVRADGGGVRAVLREPADPLQALRNKVALVTGAAGAIGAGICRGLLRLGCRVAATDVDSGKLDSLCGELAAEHPDRCVGAALDVTDPASVAAGFAGAAAAWGGVDIVVANAGIAAVGPLAEIEAAQFRRLERVNVEGALHTLAEAGRCLCRQGTGGDIVLISTKNVTAPGAQFGAYSATKAAGHQLGRIAALELAPHGIRVNMVAPDAVFGEEGRRSGLWAEVGPSRMKARGLDEKGLEEYYRGRNLLKARVTAGHVANAVLFFATRQTPTTGATLPVDGGLPDATPR